MSTLRAEHHTDTGQAIQVRQGDLTRETVDAVVNAANAHLAHGGGVAAAIVRAGGQAIQEESDRWVAENGPVPIGQVAVTGAGALPARHVIHAVGPIWEGGDADEDALLHSAVWQSLLKAHALRLASIALPAISSGIFGFPKARCAAILIGTALEFCERNPDSPLRQIRFVLRDAESVSLFEAQLRRQGSSRPAE